MKALTVSQARKIAFEMHANQTDKLGHPYSEHLEAVRQGVVVLGGSVQEQIAALFHDAVEDHKTTLNALKLLLKPEAVAMVDALTKRSGEGQEHYLDRVIKAGDGAMRVKLADLMHNTRWDRMEALKLQSGWDGGEKTVNRLLKKYRPAMARLMLELGMIVDEETQKETVKAAAASSYATTPHGSSTGWSSGYSSGTSEYQVQSLITGDWPVEWAAPIVQKLSKTDDELQRFVLANGQAVEIHKHGNDGKIASFEVIMENSWSNFGSSKLKVTKELRQAYAKLVRGTKNKGKYNADLFDSDEMLAEIADVIGE